MRNNLRSSAASFVLGTALPATAALQEGIASFEQKHLRAALAWLEPVARQDVEALAGVAMARESLLAFRQKTPSRLNDRSAERLLKRSEADRGDQALRFYR